MRDRVFQSAFVAAACIASIHACGGDGGTEPPEPPPDPPRPTTATVNPATTELTAVGATVHLTTEVRDQNGQVIVVTVTWSSSNTAVATVNASGLVTGAGNGTATITASAGTVSGSAMVTVAQEVSAVEVTSDTAIVLPGTTVQFAAEARDANGHAVAGSEFSWASSDTAVAVVDGTGLATGIAPGSVEVSATSSGATGRARLEVAEPAPAAITARPDTVLFEALGDTVRLTAEVLDQAGRPMPGEVVSWSTGDTLVAIVDSTGLMTAVGPGAATITATSGAHSSDVAVEVMQVVRGVVVSPSADTLILGDSLRLAAEALDANGHPVAAAAFTWSSSDASIATVDTSGVVRGVGEGTAGITAAVGSVQGGARITVSNPDRAPLVALYNATSGPEWLRNDNWLTDKPLAQWYGLGTDASGRVTWVNLAGRQDSRGIWTRHGLKGRIPPELGRLDRLEALSLFGNELSGTIPGELGDLARLMVLDLSDNELAGSIPPELGRLARLKQLVLRANSLEDAIPPELATLGNLEVMSIQGNGLSGPIPAAFGNLASLRHLNLRGNNLSDLIPRELGSLANLEQLLLDNNRLTGPIPAELGKLSNLNHLWLQTNGLTGPIPPELGNLTELSGLVLYANQLSGPIPPELGSLTKLNLLMLSTNGLTGSIPAELGALTGLATLTLHTNELVGPIPSTVGNLERLTNLQLHNNALTGSIPPELGNLAALKLLLLGDNDLSGPIPAELGDLHELDRLVLGRNALTGPVPARLGKLATLTHLLLEENELEGPVPPEFGALTALREFNLTNNAEMTGMLPAGLTALTRLDVFLAGGTELCAPSEVDFESWLGGIWRHRIIRCPEASPSTAYLVQAVQSREFPVPLVAGEDALLRVFVTARQATSERIPPVRARFFVNDRETLVEDIPGKRSPIPTGVDESNLGSSANAVVPGSVIQPGLAMVIEVDPDGTLDPGLGVARRIPETGRLRIDVHDMPALDLTIIPFIWSEDPDSSIVELVNGMAADPRNHEMLHFSRTLLPIGELHVRAHEPVLFPTNNRRDLLLATRAIRVMEGGTGHYKGMMAGNLGGTAYRPGRSSFSSPYPLTLAHELGHNMNLRHAPCGGAPNPDPAFPHANGVAGAWGYDFRKRALVDSSSLDVMTYCTSRESISDFHFGNALRFRLSDNDQPALPDRAAEAPSLLLWGGVDPDGSPFLEPAFVVDAPAALPDAGGDHRLIGLAADGAELFSMSFAMPEVLDGDGGSTFVFSVPMQVSWERLLTSIALSGPGGSVVLDGNSDRALAIVRNPRSGQVRGFFRAAQAEGAIQAAAMAAPGAGEALTVLFSRGIPHNAAWRR